MAELNNARHEKFAQGIASGMSQRTAYRAAFQSSQKWKDEVVDVKASELRKNGKVSVRISELAERASSEAIMDATQRKEWLTKLIQSKSENTNNKLKAVDILNKMDGAYVEKVEIGGNINNPMENLTTEELKKLINDG
jgi:hypothetical protein